MVKLLTNAEVRALNLRAGSARITDLWTGRQYNIFWGGQPPLRGHTDFSPLTPEDTAIMQNISDGWNWRARPVILHIGVHDLAAGVHHFPHGSIIGGNPGLPNMPNANPPAGQGWPIGGHMCLYYKDSIGGTRGMTEAAREAFNLARALGFNTEEGGEDMQRFQTVNEFHEGLRAELQALIDMGALKGNSGDGTGLDLTVAEARTLIIAARAARIIAENAGQ